MLIISLQLAEPQAQQPATGESDAQLDGRLRSALRNQLRDRRVAGLGESQIAAREPRKVSTKVGPDTAVIRFLSSQGGKAVFAKVGI
jgi:hypothetical protein